jgi:hypothetical protein
MFAKTAPCFGCGIDAPEAQVFVTGPGGIDYSGLMPVITGQSASAPFYICGRPECRDKAAKRLTRDMGWPWPPAN